MDLSGGKASAASLTARSVILAADDTRDMTSGLLLDIAPGSAVSSDRFLQPPFPRTGWSEPWVASRAGTHGSEWSDK